MAGGDGGPCGCGVLGCGFDVGDAPGDDGVGEQGESFALDVLAGSKPSRIATAWAVVVGTVHRPFRAFLSGLWNHPHPSSSRPAVLHSRPTLTTQPKTHTGFGNVAALPNRRQS